MDESSEQIQKREKPSQAFEVVAKKFYDFLNLRDEPKQADVIFILGGSSIKPVEKAAELYKSGFAKKIAFISTGGKFGGDKVWGMPENQKYEETLIGLGIPKDDIITAGLTTNTLAEAQSAVPFLQEQGLNLKSMILVSRPIHQRRAFSTFAQQYNGQRITFINCPADEPLNLNDPEEVERLVQEAERLLDYGVKKRDIKKPDIPYETMRAAATIRKYLKEKGIYTPRVKPSK